MLNSYPVVSSITLSLIATSPLFLLGETRVAVFMMIAVLLCLLLWINLLFIYSFRNLITVDPRIIVIALFNVILVIMLNQIIGAINYDLSRQLDVLFPLLAYNAFLLSQAERFMVSQSFMSLARNTAVMSFALLIIFTVFGLLSEFFATHSSIMIIFNGFVDTSAAGLTLANGILAPLFTISAGVFFLLAGIVAILNKIIQFNR